jgi:hypothetical protein
MPKTTKTPKAPKAPKATMKRRTTKSPSASKRTDAAKDAAKTERLRKAAIAEIAARIDGGEQDHEKPTAKERANTRVKPTVRPERRPSGLDLAAKVLADAGEALDCKTIAERTIAAGWVTNGKTPHATLHAAIIREIAGKGADARFQKSDRGLFTSANRKGA